jgi:hypothetical protein
MANITYTVTITLKEPILYTTNNIIVHNNVKSKGFDSVFFVVITEDDRELYYSAAVISLIEIVKDDNSRNRSQT